MNIDPTSKADQQRRRTMLRDTIRNRETIRAQTSCPACSAKPDEYCVSKSGKPRVTFHKARWTLVARTPKRHDRAVDIALIQNHLHTVGVMRYPTPPPEEIAAPRPQKLRRG